MLHPRHRDQVAQFTKRVSQRRGIRIYRYANVGNHIHLLIRFPTRAAFRDFLRELSGGIALIVTGARKGGPLPKNEMGRGFWDHIAFTRIVNFGRDFERVARYLVKNIFESAGIPMKRLLAQGVQIVTLKKDGRIVSGSPP